MNNQTDMIRTCTQLLYWLSVTLAWFLVVVVILPVVLPILMLVLAIPLLDLLLELFYGRPNPHDLPWWGYPLCLVMLGLCGWLGVRLMKAFGIADRWG